MFGALPASCPPIFDKPDCESFVQAIDTNVEPEMESGEVNFLFFFFILRAAYGVSQARGQVEATAVSLHHSHSNAGSLTH